MSALLAAGIRSERGQSLVEFALVIPMFLVMAFGIIEFGVIMMDKIQVARAADVGARAGALKGSNSATAITAATSAMGTLVSCASATPTAAYAGSPTTVTVTASCTYTPFTPLGSLVSTVIPTAISTSIVMRAEP